MIRDDYEHVRARYEELVRTGDPASILGAATSECAERLFIWLVNEEPADPAGPNKASVAVLLTWLHWYRWQALPEGEGVEDIERSLRVAFALRTQERIPEPFRLIVRTRQQLYESEHADPVLLQDCAGLHAEFAQRVQSRHFIGQAVMMLTDALSLVPSDDTRWPVIASNLGGALLTQIRITGDPGRLDEAIDLVRRAFHHTQGDLNDPVMVAVNLASALMTRYGRQQSPADLDEAISACTYASDVPFPSPVEHAVVVERLSDLLYLRSLVAGQPEDLDATIGMLRLLVADGGHAAATEQLHRLSVCLRQRHERDSRPDDLEEALTLRRRLVNRRGDLVDVYQLGRLLYARFVFAGTLSDLDGAVDLYRKAIDGLRAAGSEFAEELNSLGLALKRRFEQTGSVQDRDDAIGAGRESVALTPEGHAESLPLRLSNLATSLLARSESTGSGSDLAEALGAMDRALALEVPALDVRAMFVLNKAVMVWLRFKRERRPQDAVLAVQLSREAADMLPSTHRKKHAYRINHVSFLVEHFEVAGDLADLGEAVDVSGTALAAMPSDHPMRAMLMAARGLALLRWKEHGDVGTASSGGFDEAIGLFAEAASLLAERDPTLAKLRFNWGTALLLRGRREGRSVDIEDAMSRYRAAAESAAAPPSVRLNAAQQWGSIAAEHGQWESAAHGYSLAVETLPLVADRGLARGDQEGQLRDWPYLAAAAAAAAVRAGSPELAVELLERGRSVLWNQLLDTSSDLSRLEAAHPEMADEFRQLRGQLNA